MVREISYVDEKNRQVYFLASGREKNEDPYLTHLYRAGFDGKSLQLLTPKMPTTPSASPRMASSLLIPIREWTFRANRYCGAPTMAPK